MFHEDHNMTPIINRWDSGGRVRKGTELACQGLALPYGLLYQRRIVLVLVLLRIFYYR